MCPKIIALCLLLQGLPMLAWADDGALVCNPSVKVDPSVFEPVAPRLLTAAEQRDMQRLFDSVAGDWRGTMAELICMERREPKQYESRARLSARETRDGLQLNGKDVRIEGGNVKTYRRRFYMTADGLRLDSPGKRGEIELGRVDAKGLAFLRRYRGGIYGSSGSVAHEERYQLKLTGSRHLVVRQDFLTNGVYGGSKVWRLER